MSGPNIEDSVNGFRGAVSFPLHLVSLAARNGLHTDVSILYQSNVEWSQKIWNLAAPTGLVGLGWSLGFDMVVLDDKQTGYAGDNVYYLVAEGTPVRLYRSTVEPDYWEFDAEHHPFWRVRYYRVQELWEVALEDGNVKTFGGTPDALQYRIRWGNWSGPSRMTNGQRRVPTIWNQSRLSSPWGDSIEFEYSSFDDDVIPIGPRGATYTRASYLRRIKTDVGRSLQFEYERKLKTQEIEEFTPPHEGPPRIDYHAFQDRYETRYLKAIYAWEHTGAENDSPAPLLSIHFDYKLRNFSDDPLNSTLFKRYLTGVFYRDAEGEATPGFLFDYYGEQDEERLDKASERQDAVPKAARGALKSITYPEGKVVTYVYEEAALPGSSLSRRLDETDTGEGVPRVWVTDDYVVLLRYNRSNSRLTLSVCSWNGAWCVNRILEEDIDGTLDLKSVRVGFAEECFALGYKTDPDAGPREFRVSAFHRKFGEYGRWTQTRLAPVHIHDEDSESALVVGEDFITAVVSGERDVRRVVWNRKSCRWDDFSVELVEAGEYSIAAFSNYYVFAHYSDKTGSCVLMLSYFDAVRRAWHDEVRLDELKPILWSKGVPKLLWSTSRVFAVATYVTGIDDEKIEYEIVRYQWDEDFRARKPETLHPKPVPKETPLPYFLTLVSENVISNLGSVFRFNGESWASERIPFRFDAHKPPRFAYGNDLALMSSEQDTVLYQYNAFDDKWQNLADIYPGKEGPFLPTISERFITVEEQLYFLDERGKLRDRGPLGPDVTSSKIANQGPSYIAYADPRENTHIVFLENGAFFGRSETIDERLFPDKEGAPGTTLTGPDSFVTYRETDFDEARELTLYKLLRGRVHGPVPHARVSNLIIDDGFEARSMSYAYEGVATTGPHGLATQYSQVRVVDGSADPIQRPFGSTLLEYHNGQIQPPSEEPYYSLLNGSLRSTSVFDDTDTLVSKTEIEWQVLGSRESPTGETVSLHGAYVRQKSSTMVMVCERIPLDEAGTGSRETEWDSTAEVIQRTEFTYAEINGAVRSKVTENHNSEGRLERVVVENLYGCEVYPGMLEANRLSSTAQTTTRVNGEITSRSVILWSNKWCGVHGNPVWAPYRTYHARSAEARLTDDEWSAQRTPAAKDWLLASEVVSRNGYGTVTASRDTDGVVESLLYDKEGWQPVAKLSNGLITGDGAEAAYVGFEAYESFEGWTFSDGTSIKGSLVSGDACTGEQSLRLAPDPQRRLTRTLTPSQPLQSFLLCGWLKTEPEFHSQPGGAQWTVTVAPEVGAPVEVQIPITDTDAQWVYFSAVIDVRSLIELAADRDPVVTIALHAADTKATAGVLIDHVYFGPLLGDFTANVYDPSTRMMTATIAPDADVEYLLYDRHLQESARIGAARTVTTLSLASHWREHFNRSVMPPPLNTFTAVAARSSGLYERFYDGDQWKRRWTGGSPSWRVKKDTLEHAQSTGEETISYEPSESLTNYSVYLRVRPLQESINRPVGLRIGSSCEVAWSAETGWSLDFHGFLENLKGLDEAPSPRPAQEWLLLVTSSALHFFADGDLIFARPLSSPLTGPLTLFASDAVAFGDLVVALECSGEMQYADGDGKVRQTQSLIEEGLIVSAQEYDALHRPDIKTKAAILGRPTFGFSPSFVTGIDRVSGVMTGDLADYYRGQEGRSDDEFYPYHRMVFEPSPLGREVKNGLPGKEFAIVQERVDGRIVDRNPHIARYRYGCNGAAGPADLPVAQYSAVQQIDADGVSTTVLTDKRGSKVLAATGPITSPDSHLVARSFFDPMGRLVRLITPAQAGRSPTPSEGAPLVNSMRYDFLGRAVERHTVDSGVSKAIYDLSGRLRFEVSNQGLRKEPNHFVVYTKYDTLGRTVEGGVVEFPWGDGEALRTIAESDPSWPAADSGVAHHWIKRFTYDKCNPDVSEPYRCDYGLGLLAKAECMSDDGAGNVTYDFSYDIRGNLVRQTATISGAHPKRSDVDYRYDGNGVLTGITYPDGFALTYRFNSIGQLTAVYDEKAREDIARYRFNAEGQMTQRRLMSDGKAVGATLNHLSPGWPERIRYTNHDDTLLFEESLRYTEAEQKGETIPGYHTGRIVQIVQRFGKWAPWKDYDVVFRTDGLGRLIRATDSLEPAHGIQRITYDENGNITSMERGCREESYAYFPGTNKVKRVTGPGGVVVNELAYDGKGQITATSARGLDAMAYNEATGMVTKLTRKGEQKRFLYDIDNHRVRRTGGGPDPTDTTAVIGPNGHRLLEIDGRQSKRYIYGPDGLLAKDCAGRRHLYISDYQGSMRIVLSNGEVVAGFNYHPFGSLREAPFGDQETVGAILNRFTGQRYEPDLGLYDFGARFYDPELGRFLGRDNAGQFYSPYLYAGNAPHNVIDPNGEFAVSVALAILAISALLGGTANAATHAREIKNAGDFFYYFGVGAGVAAVTAVPVAGVVANSAAAAGGIAAAYAAAYESGGAGLSGAVIGTAAVDGALTNGFNNLHEGNRFEDGLVTSAAIAAGTAVVFEAASAAMSRLGKPQMRGGPGGRNKRFEGEFHAQQPGRPKNAAGRTVLSGHGALTNARGKVRVPRGTSVTFYGPPGSTLSNRAGQAVETGAAIAHPERLRMVIRERVERKWFIFKRTVNRQVISGVDPVTYRAGERIPNYQLAPISRDWLSSSPHANYLTVRGPTRLNELLKPGMGKVDWGACTSFRKGEEPTTATIWIDWA